MASVNESGAAQPAILTMTVTAGRPRLGADKLAGMIMALTRVLACIAGNDGEVSLEPGVSNLLVGFSEYVDNQRLAVELALDSTAEPLVQQAFAWLETLRGFNYEELAAPKHFLNAALDLAHFVNQDHAQEMWLSRTGGASVHITDDTFEHAMQLLS